MSLLDKIFGGLVAILLGILGFFQVRRSNEKAERASHRANVATAHLKIRDEQEKKLRKELNEELTEDNLSKRDYFTRK